MMEERDPFDEYAVVANDEHQYSIWPTCKPTPAGWIAAGYQGSKASCLDFIDRTWLDMRPRSATLG